MSNIFVSVKDFGQFLESRTLGFDKEEIDEGEFDKDPNLVNSQRRYIVNGDLSYSVECCQVPGGWEILPRNWVGVATNRQQENSNGDGIPTFQGRECLAQSNSLS